MLNNWNLIKPIGKAKKKKKGNKMQCPIQDGIILHCGVWKLNR